MGHISRASAEFSGVGFAPGRSPCVRMGCLRCFSGVSLTTFLLSWLLFLLKSGNWVCVKVSHRCSKPGLKVLELLLLTLGCGQ